MILPPKPDPAPDPAGAEGAPKILTRGDGATIAYRRRNGKGPGIVFISGFMSNMEGTKARFLDDFAASRGRAYLRFDTFGHGASSGDFAEGTIGRWREDVITVLENLTEGPQILVGSSLGGWLMLLAALARPERIAALIGIAAAPDATEALMWNRFPPALRERIERDGAARLPSFYGDDGYLITHKLIMEGRQHLLMGSALPIACPVRLLQGMEDPDVPWQTSLDLMQKITGGDVELILIKDGDHRLSREHDLALLAQTIESLS